MQGGAEQGAPWRGCTAALGAEERRSLASAGRVAGGVIAAFIVLGRERRSEAGLLALTGGTGGEWRAAGRAGICGGAIGRRSGVAGHDLVVIGRARSWARRDGFAERAEWWSGPCAVAIAVEVKEAGLGRWRREA